MSYGANPPSCEYCGMYHKTKCPMVKAIEYRDGRITRVEFFGSFETDMRRVLHRIGEEASSFRGMGGGYAEIDRDPYCIVRELQAAYKAIWPNGWAAPAPTGERNHLIAGPK